MPTFNRPKRKRGYYRALKQGKDWAIHEQMVKNMTNDIAKKLYSDLLKENPFLGIINAKVK